MRKENIDREQELARRAANRTAIQKKAHEVAALLDGVPAHEARLVLAKVKDIVSSACFVDLGRAQSSSSSSK